MSNNSWWRMKDIKSVKKEREEQDTSDFLWILFLRFYWQQKFCCMFRGWRNGSPTDDISEWLDQNSWLWFNVKKKREGGKNWSLRGFYFNWKKGSKPIFTFRTIMLRYHYRIIRENEVLILSYVCFIKEAKKKKYANRYYLLKIDL